MPLIIALFAKLLLKEYLWLNIGDIMEKKSGSDTITVCNSNNEPQYLFELLDGMQSKWVPLNYRNHISHKTIAD